MIKPACEKGKDSRKETAQTTMQNLMIMFSTEEEVNTATGDYVKVIYGAFRDYFAIVVGDTYREEIEIQYFKKKEKWWILTAAQKKSYRRLRKCAWINAHQIFLMKPWLHKR